MPYAICDCPQCKALSLDAWTPGSSGAFDLVAGDELAPMRGDASAVGSNVNASAYVNAVQFGAQWSGAIRYSFPTGVSNYEGGYYDQAALTTGFAAATSTQKAAVRDIFGGGLSGPTYFKYGSYASVISSSISEMAVSPGVVSTAEVRIADSGAPSTAYAYYPNSNPVGGDVWIGKSQGTYLTPVLGSYGWVTHVHELGHALGLKHPHDAGATAGFGAMPVDRDAMEFSVMSYHSYANSGFGGYTNETYGFAQTLMMYDIAALQFMYGADYGTNSGATTYTWNPNTGEMSLNGVRQGAPGANRIFLTTWDGGGIDTYDLTNYTTSLSVNLNPGGWSSFSPSQLAQLGNGHYALGNVYNALLVGSDTRSYIENAVGGSGNDNLTGNDAANTLYGGGGSDIEAGGSGVDMLYGGADGDTLWGGNDGDSIYGGAGNDLLHGDLGADYVLGDLGNDTLLGGDSDDSLAGGAGNDTIDGGAGSDYVDFASFSEIVTVDLGRSLALTAASGNDTLISIERVGGGMFGDVLTGDGLTNILSGINGDDRLSGLGGHDTLFGGLGNDVIEGGSGADWLYGGAGADFFVFGPGPAGTGSDRLFDFQPGTDRLDVTAFGYRSLSDIAAAGGGRVQDGGDVVLTLAVGGNPASVRVHGSAVGDLTGSRFVFADPIGSTEVARLYDTAFDRDADPGGLATHVGAIDQGASLRDLAAVFVGSAEFGADNGANLSDAAFVDALYWNALGRPAEAAGKAFHVDALATGTSRADLLLAFSESTEHQSTGNVHAPVNAPTALAQVTRLYDTAFDRDPDAGGLEAHLAAMGHGTSLASLAAVFVGSAEFSADNGANLSDAAFVDALYWNALGRPAEAAGKAFHVDALATGTSRADLLLAFSESTEHQSTGNVHAPVNAPTALAQVTRLYDTAFDRDPDAGGLEAHLAAMGHGTSLASLAAAFVGSAEFSADNGANLSDAAFVDALYWNALSRPAEAAGKAFHVDALANGMSRADLMLAFSESAEHIALGNIHM